MRNKKTWVRHWLYLFYPRAGAMATTEITWGSQCYAFIHHYWQVSCASNSADRSVIDGLFPVVPCHHLQAAFLFIPSKKNNKGPTLVIKGGMGRSSFESAFLQNAFKLLEQVRKYVEGVTDTLIYVLNKENLPTCNYKLLKDLENTRRKQKKFFIKMELLFS